MDKSKLTPIQQKILDYIKEETLTKGFPPSVRDICAAVNLKSTSSVFTHLGNLEKKGYIKRDPTKPRAITICDDSFNMIRTEIVSIPVVGQVAAGSPILAEENIDSYIPIPASMCPKGSDAFILNVKGDSMINAGIYNGDQIFVEVCNTAKNGEQVVALIDDSATVKTFYKENNHIRLQPENDTMDPIIVDDCKILGRVFGVMRFYK
ncbi:MAG: transcriptional repressor LexA [Butyrivibrio sp.]|jgi:repressor LexA|uniref:transcriptional repressor LexA n=1 Tax=Butyrivibrio sp. LB2008 TaxID=1408305 RepID=UPI000478B9D6|nr:transcriptional repressor LexA [Butyrivibrio sp. LB2008]MEE3494957.1 transcriptional repressor LexA [Butyrivibrio sp.]